MQPASRRSDHLEVYMWDEWEAGGEGEGRGGGEGGVDSGPECGR